MKSRERRGVRWRPTTPLSPRPALPKAGLRFAGTALRKRSAPPSWGGGGKPLLLTRVVGPLDHAMSCQCSLLPAIVRFEDHPELERGSEELERDAWFWLVRCRSCGQLWSLDEWDKLQSQFAIKIRQREGWRELDTSAQRKQYLVQSRGGLTEELCLWHGCEQRRVRGVVYCADHLYETGARE